ncbi:MAG: thiamine pyrophosphate-binding protein [Actinomycetota bacterium]|nr:thiamine pyrophosphate-binding protein [Actinomycetota bacterium]
MRGDRPTSAFDARSNERFNSDAVAESLRSLGLEYLALNPGASYRGLHDSIVNVLGNENPTMLLCLHEEHAVAIAHGFAKVTERPIGVALHSNVGLMHATMALFNAWCDRVPMVVVGATGPLDAAERRPWIDWIHTAADQGALVRSYVKWDDQPTSAQAAVESIAQAYVRTWTYPCAPTYVNLDAQMQEASMSKPVRLPDPKRHRPVPPPAPRPEAVQRLAAALNSARRPLLLVGRVSRSEEAWQRRIELAERLGASVLCDLKTGAGFPTGHALNPAAPGTFLSPAGRELVRAADVIVSLDWIDLAGTLKQAYGTDQVEAWTVSCTMDFVLHNGWSKDHFGLAPIDLEIESHPDLLVNALAEQLGSGPPTLRDEWPPTDLTRSPRLLGEDGDEILVGDLARALDEALRDLPATLVRLPLGFDGADLVVSHPLDYLGHDGGGGVGAGPGLAVGAALALDGTDRLPVAVLGDGDFLMGNAALWTASHHRLPLLIVVSDNGSFFNDEVHQEHVARHRGRPVENRWVGQRISDPAPDIPMLARSLGFEAPAPVEHLDELAGALSEAVARVADGGRVLVDVRVGAKGYPGGPPPGGDRASKAAAKSSP